MAAYSNQLVNETSPYLLQHAHNPVQWYPWGDTALNKALAEDKPILVSIGYAACHWCHVMERESFEDEEIAAFMNEHFINIKIDREERPDLDHIYMSAVQTLTGSGGWPLNVFLTPQKKPFYGGTYFPPQPIQNRPSWSQILMGVAEAFYEKRDKLEDSAARLTAQIEESAGFGLGEAGTDLNQETLDIIYKNIMSTADTTLGGFGGAPKFPQTYIIKYLLKYYYYTNHTPALDQALLSLDKMMYGGIYDQLGGGFARYSTDASWLAPHFEKMLYDNALLVQVLCDAYQLSGEKRYLEVIDETMAFVARELLSPEGGFYSALDADSEGVEGKFYVWSLAEIQEVLGADANLFCKYYDVTEHGNWEETNILNVRVPLAAFAEKEQIDLTFLKEQLANGKQRLMKERDKRIRPLLDDKVLLGWNALMNTACSKAYAATGNPVYKNLAISNMDFLLDVFCVNGEWKHGYKEEQATNPAFLDDYANVIEALVQLQEITGDQQYLHKAKALTDIALEFFYDHASGLFYYTHQSQQDVIIRTKEVYDGATPSANATMAQNLQYLSLIFDNNVWRTVGEKMINAVAKITTRYPTSFGKWACLMTGLINGKTEIAVVGHHFSDLLPEILSKYLPDSVLQASDENESSFPLLKNRYQAVTTHIYYCKNYACYKPVTKPTELFELIGDKSKTVGR